MRLFTGYRPNPRPEYKDAGLTNSGERADYQGVVFDDGTVVLRWLTEHKSHSVWKNYRAFYKVHGHPEYGTRIEWVQAQPGKIVMVEQTDRIEMDPPDFFDMCSAPDDEAF